MHFFGASLTPTPASTTRRALSGLSQFVGTTTSGTPARRDERIVDVPPAVTIAAQRGISSSWLSHRVRWTFGASGPPRSSASGSRWRPVVRIASTGEPASPWAAARRMNGSP